MIADRDFRIESLENDVISMGQARSDAKQPELSEVPDVPPPDTDAGSDTPTKVDADAESNAAAEPETEAEVDAEADLAADQITASGGSAQ